MEFDGTFELTETTTDDVWLALSDPVMIQHALPGCQFLVEVDSDDPDFDALREEHEGDDLELTADPDVIEERAFQEGHTYAALVEISVGSVSPSFETTVTIDRREFPEMDASGEGSAGNSSFEMDSGMVLSQAGDGVAVDWQAQADVFGRIAQMGQRMLNPVANRVVKRFFQNMQDQLEELQFEADTDADREEGSADESERGGAESDPDAGQKKKDKSGSKGVVDRIRGALGGDKDDDS